MRFQVQSTLLAKFSTAMFVLCGFFCCSSSPSWLPIPCASDFPNCVSFGWDTDLFAIGALSNNSVSTLFVTSDDILAEASQKNTKWSERRDGHFCGYYMPDVGLGEPGLFGVWLSTKTIGWHCPYWAMMALWAAVYVQTGGFRPVDRDWFLALALCVLLVLCVEFRVTLPFVIFLNVSTAILTIILIAFLPLLIFGWGKLPRNFLKSLTGLCHSVSEPSDNDRLSRSEKAIVLLFLISISSVAFFCDKSIWIGGSMRYSECRSFGIAVNEFEFEMPQGNFQVRPGVKANWDELFACTKTHVIAVDHTDVIAIATTKNPCGNKDWRSAVDMRKFNRNIILTGRKVGWLTGSQTQPFQIERPCFAFYWIGIAVLFLISIAQSSRKKSRALWILLVVFGVAIVMWKSISAGSATTVFSFYLPGMVLAPLLGRVLSKHLTIPRWQSSN